MVYLDNAATTALDSDVLQAMQPYLSEQFGNASSVHAYGREARMAVERARQIAADVLSAQPKEIIFTSSATEANNLAVKGVIEWVHDMHPSAPLEIVATPIEHPCTLEALKHVDKLGWAKIVWLPVGVDGLVSADSVAAAINENTVLVSVMYVNNEIGTVMPISSIAEEIRRVRKHRGTAELPLYFHTDAVQAVQYLDCHVDRLGVDLLSLTGHKLYGPKGSGLLYVRDGIHIVRQIDGGGQEYYKRAGTENVAGIVGFAAALQKYAWNESAQFDDMKEIQRFLINEITARISDSRLTGHRELRAPHITSFIFEDVDPEALIISLDRAGFAVSSGSACSSGIVRQSHVIDALHLDIAKKSAALRVSTGNQTTQADMASFVEVLVKSVTQLRDLRL
jgi:cysteine desulfurase